MRALLRENALCAAVAAGACATMAWLGLYGYAFGDYELEAEPSLHALVTGHLGEFLRLAPAYGGSLIERAPFALLPGLWGGGELAVYRMVALPGLLATALLGVWLLARLRARGAPLLARAVALGVAVANPITLRALELGHSEELLAACMCIAAVLIASGGSDSTRSRRALLAGVVLGLAIADKESAVLATGPVLACLPAGRRLRCLLAAVASAGVVLAPLVLVPGSAFTAGTRGLASTGSTIFQPWQVWWFFGHHGALVRGTFGAPKLGYRIGPSWASTLSHPLILAVGAALAVALLARSRVRERTGAGPLPRQQALLALSLVALLRCVLDTWDVVYYLLPFLFAVLVWEAERAPRRPPVLALLASALAWASFQWLPGHVSADAQSALFLAWSLPLAGSLAWALVRSERAERAGSAGSARGMGRLLTQEITVRTFGRRVRTS
jgi:hypothetical protein